MAVDTLGQLLTTILTSGDEQERAQVDALAAQVQYVAGNSIEVAFVDQGYTGERADDDFKANAVLLVVVKLPTAKRCFVLRSRRWAVERGFAPWLASVAWLATTNAWE